MKWSSSKKEKIVPEMEVADLVADTSDLSLQPQASTIPRSPDAPILSHTEVITTHESTLEIDPTTNPNPTLPLDLSPHPSTTSPPPYSPHPAFPSPTTSISPTNSTSPPPKRPNPLTKRISSMKSAVEDGRATSFAKAACSGGMRAQKSFFKAEAVTQAVKTGNVPLVAFNAARAVYKGGKEARMTFKEAEKVRVERLEREGEGYVRLEGEGSEGEVEVEVMVKEIMTKGAKGKEEKKGKKKGDWMGRKEVV